jgi:hypothetical protein
VADGSKEEEACAVAVQPRRAVAGVDEDGGAPGKTTPSKLLRGGRAPKRGRGRGSAGHTKGDGGAPAA